jgi:hypothetical protein
MKAPPVDRLYASVSRPLLPMPCEFEYVLWYQLQGFPIMVRVSAA